MSLGGIEGGLKYTPSNFLFKYTPKFFGKKAVLSKSFGTSLDFHKSAVKVSKKFCPPKIFLNPYTPHPHP
jgi:hypothetical protein